MLGEELKQHAVRDAAVDDRDGVDAGFDDLDTAFDLGNHATRNGAVADHGPRFVDREVRDQLLVLVENSGDVGEHQQALGLEACGQSRSKGIAVDIEGLAIARHADGCDDGDQIGFGDDLDDVRVHLDRVADIADVDRLHDIAFGVRHLGAITGLIHMVHQIFGGIGAYGGALVFDSTGSYDAAFIFLLAASAFALVLTLTLRKPYGA